MVSVITKALAFAQGLGDKMSIRTIPVCSVYLRITISEERHQFTLDALKGSSGILFSIARASQVIFLQSSQESEFAVDECRKVLMLYVDMLKGITINLIHPTVMRRCSRRLQQHPLMLETDGSRFQLLVEASKVLVKAVDRWK
ncbi:hypothetical protein C8J56DRAFT_1162525 [Mycena floridula]|nr:hypothetical protein C8J56DRAFT_1162525 [Mycena floridula]